MGPAGAGKTYTALTVAAELGERIAVLDTERGSASKYADKFSFDVVELESFDPRRYVEVIEAADQAGYQVLVIDSLSHAWTGKGGALELVDQATARSKSRNSYAAWRHVTPLHNQLVDAILGCNCHVIVTMRTKTEYVLEDNGRGGKVPRKMGMAPIQRDGLDYEFDVVGDMDWEHTLVVTKSRIPDLSDQVYKKPGPAFGQALAAWVGVGAAMAPAPPPEERELTAEDLRAILKKRMDADAWSVSGATALIATFGVQSANDLPAADRLEMARILTTMTVHEWAERGA
jgi:hypothetical protein|tara:strand:+ start:234 stop:1097 length:864 start_codon:yes stop_codon:yes gene_type:complete